MARADLLLVDDDEMSSQILVYILADEGYEADTVATGATAVEKFSAKHYDLVILDYVLPDMKGRGGEGAQDQARWEDILLTGYAKDGGPGTTITTGF
jgi:DNA-binding response OmpR family regulator